VFWRVLAPGEPQVPPSLEEAAIRIVHGMTPRKPLPARAAKEADGPARTA
jgi:hypothetical protein